MSTTARTRPLSPLPWWRTPLGLALALLVTLGAVPGCDEALLDPLDGGGTGGVEVLSGPDAGPAKAHQLYVPKEVVAKVFDPKTRRSDEEAAASLAALKAGEDFNALEVLPEVKRASQKVADEVKLSPDGMTVPLEGNEELLQLETGAVLTGDVAGAKNRVANGGNNIFGFIRKVKSVKKVGDNIEIETARASLKDVFAGGVQTSVDWEDVRNAETIDTTGVDLREYFSDLGEDYVPGAPSRGAFEQSGGAWGVDYDFSDHFAYTGKFSVSTDQLPLGGISGVPYGSKSIPLDIGLKITVEPTFEFSPAFQFGFDVEVPWDVWNTHVSYFRAIASGKLKLGAKTDVDVSVKLGAAASQQLSASAKAFLLQEAMSSHRKQPAQALTWTLKGLPEWGPKKIFSIAGVPVVMLIQIKVECAVGAAGQANLSAKGGFEVFARLGVEYLHDKGITIPSDFNFNSYGGVDLHGGKVSGLVKCTVGPHTEVLLAGVGGPYVDAMAYAQAELGLDSACPDPAKLGQSGPPPLKTFANASVGLSVSIGGKMDIAGVWDYDFGSKELWGQEIKKWPWSKDLGTGLGKCASDCENGVQDDSEPTTDCGGPVCKKCGPGSACQTKQDCSGKLNCFKPKGGGWGYCSSLNENEPCNNGKQDNGEFDVDCGGSCPPGKCKAGSRCKSNKDCSSKMCNGPYKCISSSCMPTCANFNCENGYHDAPFETDVDCGGPCGPCTVLKRCGKHSDCKTGACESFTNGKRCAFTECKGYTNGYKNGKETGVDCGGPCVAGMTSYYAKEYELAYKGLSGDNIFKCPGGQGCATGADCAGGICAGNKKCGDRCSDGVRNFGETGVDCGGPCKKCGYLKGCLGDEDCAQSSTKMACSYQRCGGKDPNMKCKTFPVDWGELLKESKTITKACVKWWETGACGEKSPIHKCGPGDWCTKDADCQPGYVCPLIKGKIRVCLPKGTCFDGKKTDTESDVDCGTACGGPSKKGCAPLKHCYVHADCASGICRFGYCRTICTNYLWDPKVGETDTDCGGANCKKKCATNRKCKVDVDCISDFCSPATSRCEINTCKDGIVNDDESDVDCGGLCKLKCGLDKSCKANGDCASDNCADKKCALALCENGKLDSGETDVDCGGSCATQCDDGKTCSNGEDCKAGQCLQGFICGFDLCQDGKKSGAETAVDCGGGCTTKCAVGQGCATSKDCASTFCNGQVCVPTGCDDNAWTPGEGDVDCGGPCKKKCAVGKKCKTASDCGSTFCDGTVCVATACVDKKKSPLETDVDCGGACPKKCPLKGGCKKDDDCASTYCDGAVCVAASCFDNIKNGTETDEDCGGPCESKCSTGKTCKTGADCVSTLCTIKGVCVLDQCATGVLDGDETDVDCGGSCKTPCLNGGKCKITADCFSSVCAVKSLVCVKDACFDEQQGGDEMAVDCGGGCAAGCATGAACKKTGDCLSGFCSVGGLCVATQCEDGMANANETGIDCGGSCDTACTFGVGCKTADDCSTLHCSKAGTCDCAPGLVWDGGSKTCVDCACAAPGTVDSVCDGAGVCACNPGWGGKKCDVKTNVCLADKLNCDDKDACSKDSCDPKTGCVHDGTESEGKPCDDGSACTSETTCKSGKCTAAKTVTCVDDGNACTLEACDQADGVCKTKDVVCDDGNSCTLDTCNTVTGKCGQTLPPDGTLCDAGSACKWHDTCIAGTCVAIPVAEKCDDAIDNDCNGETDEDCPFCGDGLLRAGETCDDKNTKDNDGCSAKCLIENGWACSGLPSVCTLPKSFKLNGSGCTYTSRILSDGTLICGTNAGVGRYYKNGSGATAAADLNLDGKVDVTYQAGGTWADFVTGLGTNLATFADNPANGDVYMTRVIPSGGGKIAILKHAGGVTGAETVLATGLGYIALSSGITSDDKTLYVQTSASTIGRWTMATGAKVSADLAITGAPSQVVGLAVGADHLYMQTRYQIVRLSKTANGPATIILGTGKAGSSAPVDGAVGTSVAITVSSFSAASVVQGRVYFVDQTGYSKALVRYIGPDGKIQTVEELVSGINQGVFVRGNVAFARALTLYLPIAIP